MSRFVTSVLAAVLLLIPALPVLAQEEPEATHVVVRYFKCNPQDAGIDWLQTWRPAAEEMVEDGRFLSYRILTHNWGDEWNVVDELTVSGLSDFFAIIGEYFIRTNLLTLESAEAEELPPFNEVCTEHKDNIYRIVPPL